MTDTSPTELRRRIDAETDAALRHARESDDTSRWERLLVNQAVHNVKLDMLSERIEKHEQSDEKNFAGLRTQVTQTIGDSVSGKTVGIVVAAIAIAAGVIAWLKSYIGGAS